MGFLDLTIGILEEHGPRAMDDPQAAAGECSGVLSGCDPVAGSFDRYETHGWLTDETAEDPDRIRATTDTGDDQVWQTAFRVLQLGGRFVADDALEVAHDRWIGMRAHGRAQDV